MNTEETKVSESLPNGSGAAALLATGIGACLLAILAIVADKMAAVKSLMIFYKPTGPLSGVTASAILIWLLVWAILDWRWRKQNVPLRPVITWALVLLGLGLLLTFSPIADLF
jgi:hypothetical protein